MNMLIIVNNSLFDWRSNFVIASCTISQWYLVKN